jgi:hypothetical protein
MIDKYKQAFQEEARELLTEIRERRGRLFSRRLIPLRATAPVEPVAMHHTRQEEAQHDADGAGQHQHELDDGIDEAGLQSPGR